MKRILITSSSKTSSVSFLKSFEGIQSYDFFMADRDMYAPGLFLVPKEKRIILSTESNEEYINELLSVCKSNKIDLVVPISSRDLIPLRNHVSDFEKIGCKVLIASKKTLQLCEDKLTLISKAKDIFPEHEFYPYDEHLNIHELKLPMMMKPRKASDVRLPTKIYAKTQLQTYKRDGSFFLQEYLPGKEYSVDVYRNQNGVVVACVPRERLQIKQGMVMTGLTVRHPLLVETACKIADKIDVFGVANMQFREDKNNQPVLMEINLRFPPSIILTVKAGVNIPLLFVQEVLENKIQNELLPYQEIAMTRIYEEKFFDPKEIM
ncbi:MAG: ATP-grasp domain-containing protein [Bdellovibrionales bacterium]|nr:ATP-grasp domain-containing protein [Bdellovibrionales bacterium]